MESYIEIRNNELRGNMDSYYVDQIIIDNDGAQCIITNKSFSFIEVYIEKKKKEGINCKQWFHIKDFEKRFKIK